MQILLQNLQCSIVLSQKQQVSVFPVQHDKFIIIHKKHSHTPYPCQDLSFVLRLVLISPRGELSGLTNCHIYVDRDEECSLLLLPYFSVNTGKVRRLIYITWQSLKEHSLRIQSCLFQSSKVPLDGMDQLGSSGGHVSLLTHPVQHLYQTFEGEYNMRVTLRSLLFKVKYFANWWYGAICAY